MILKSAARANGRARLEISEEQKTEATGREMAGIQFVMLACDKMEQYEGSLLARLRSVPDGVRRYCMCKTLLCNLLGDLYDTLPQHQLRGMEAVIKHGEVVIRPRRVGNEDDAAVVPSSTLEQLCDLAIKNECGLCVRSETQIRQCKVRKLLMGLMAPERLPAHGCPYRVFGMDDGEDEGL